MKLKQQLALVLQIKLVHQLSHGAPLGADEIKLTKANYEWDNEETSMFLKKFLITINQFAEAGKEKENAWNELFEAYKKAHPELAKQLESAI